MGHHSKLSPSSGTRWLNCPGCIGLVAPLPEQPSSIYADEGSAAHELGERCLHLNMDAIHFKGQKIEITDHVTDLTRTFVVDDDMIKAVQVYIDEIDRQIRTAGGSVECKVEQKLDASWVAPELYGTGDHVLTVPLSHIHVTDYKHGKGVPVDVEDNVQLKIYALGALGEGNPHMVSEIRVTIVQPRSFHADGPIRTVTYTVAELMEWGETVLKPGAERAMLPAQPLKTGPWCRWCDAKNPIESVSWDGCPEINNQVKTNAIEMFGTFDPNKITLADPGELTAEELDKRLQLIDVFRAWCDGMENEAVKRLMEESPSAPRTKKLVAGRSIRKWADVDKTIEAMKNLKLEKIAYTEPQLKSPAQLRTAVDKAGLDATVLVDPLVIKPEGKPTMVDVGDKRPALKSNTDKMFGEYINPLA